MTVPLFQVDVFAERLFAGNPAAVCPLPHWLPDAVMQQIAAENNLSETAFFVPDDSGEADYLLRWFTPTIEIELCGHATLASGHVVFNELGFSRDIVRFRTLHAGVLQVRREAQKLWLQLPATPPQALDKIPDALLEGLRVLPKEILYAANKYFALYDDAQQVAALSPHFSALRSLTNAGVVVTAPGRDGQEDFVSRFFAPAWGIDEDPATGSAHCLLVPYWAARLGRRQLHAAQLSARGARLECRLDGEQVWLSGGVQPYLTGKIRVRT